MLYWHATKYIKKNNKYVCSQNIPSKFLKRSTLYETVNDVVSQKQLNKRNLKNCWKIMIPSKEIFSTTFFQKSIVWLSYWVFWWFLESFIFEKMCNNDNLFPAVFKMCKHEIFPYLLEIFNCIVDTSHYADILKIVNVVPTLEVANAIVEFKYRQLSILNVIDILWL